MTTARMQLLVMLTACLAMGAADRADGGSETGAAKRTVPDGAVEFEGHAYLLVDEVEDLSWSLARKRCSDEGGHLAVVTSRAESDFIRDLCDGRYMFLGASDAGQEGEWAWVYGSPWSFTNWLDGQPNDYSGSEDYLATYDGGKWVDVDASGDGFWMPTGFICEWDQAG